MTDLRRLQLPGNWSRGGPLEDEEAVAEADPIPDGAGTGGPQSMQPTPLSAHQGARRNSDL